MPNMVLAIQLNFEVTTHHVLFSTQIGCEKKTMSSFTSHSTDENNMTNVRSMQLAFHNIIQLVLCTWWDQEYAEFYSKLYMLILSYQQIWHDKLGRGTVINVF